MVAVDDAGELLLSPGQALDEDQRQDDDQHKKRKTCGAGEIGTIDPGRVDRQGQRLNAKEFGGSDIVERLHQRQARADGDRRSSEGERDPCENP